MRNNWPFLEGFANVHMHPSAVDGVLEVSVQPLVMVRVKVGEEVGGATRNGPILERVYNNTGTCSRE